MDIWLTIALALAVNLVMVGTAYGLLVGRVRAVEQTVERHETGKASAEAVQLVTGAIMDLRKDMDKRLDRIEWMVSPRGRDDTSPGRPR